MMPDFAEIPVVFPCQNESLVGVVHKSSAPTNVGVLIIVGGPQYRVGSHRQFVLLSRFLATNGVNVMRFDYRGMGDGSGGARTFENVGDDIEKAIDKFLLVCPGIEKVCLWGLCDAASAALFYAHRDKRVDRLILLNPWVRTEAGEAKAYLKHYYLSRLMSLSFWRKLLMGGVRFGHSLKSASDMSIAARGGNESSESSLPERMLNSFQQFEGEVFIILSGDDLTAAEFSDLIDSNGSWRKMINTPQVELKCMDDANHTFSSQIWRSKVQKWTLDWLVN